MTMPKEERSVRVEYKIYADHFPYLLLLLLHSTISSENPSDLALRVSVEEEMTSTPVAA